MSDRLRDAAAALTSTSVSGSGTMVLRVPTAQDVAVAVLLRAVADEWCECFCGPEWTERGRHKPGCAADDMHDTYRAALALADVILGDG